MFKNIKYILSICCIILASAFLCACNSDSIKINGNFEETIEVNTVYNDSGISCSDKYNVITEGEVDNLTIGRYQLVYKVYSQDGELVKELSRYVNVVDTTAPTYVENTTTTTYYAGFSYGINDFITYSDNYDTSATIQTDFSTITFTAPGNQRIRIKLTDSSNNETIFTKNINVVLDLDRLVRNVYQNQLSKITTTSPEGHGTFTHVNIDTTTSFSYLDTGNISFIKSSSLESGNRALIQISATQYGKFNNASISFHVTDSFYSNVYSVGFANIDATKQYTELTISQFSSTINNIPLNETEMLNDCNANLLGVLNEFQNYMINILHLEIK